MFWLLCPMMLQQCSSINYDSILIPVCFFLTAYILKLKYDTEKIGWVKLFTIGLLTLLILLIKPPYILIAGMIFIIPLDRFDLRLGKKIAIQEIIKKYKVVFVIAGVALAVLAAYIMRHSFYVKLIYLSITKPREMIRLFKNSFHEIQNYYIYTLVGCFAWL